MTGDGCARRPFLDIRIRASPTGSEQGLLSVAFHPRYSRNHLYYVDYTDRGGDTRIVEYRSRGLAREARSDEADLLFLDDPYPNHNGGQLAFGLGRLPVLPGMGDGRSQKRCGECRRRTCNLLFGKIIRFNVNRRDPQPVIVGYGVRNPWRFWFDRRPGPVHR